LRELEFSCILLGTITFLNFLRWKIENSLSSVILFKKEPKRKTILFIWLDQDGTTGLDKEGRLHFG
jgi:hypothetical protein